VTKVPSCVLPDCVVRGAAVAFGCVARSSKVGWEWVQYSFGTRRDSPLRDEQYGGKECGGNGGPREPD